MNYSHPSEPIHLCLSMDPSCSGCCPCQACVDFIMAGRVQGQMVWPSGGVVPRAMYLAGPPFNLDPNLAASFMRAYAQALFDGGQFASGLIRTNLASQQSAQLLAQQAQQAAQQQAAQQQAFFAAQIAAQQPPPPPRRTAPGPSPTPQKELSEHEYLLIFQDQMLTGLKTMSPEDKARMAQGVSSETLEGWALLSESEKEILRAIFLPPTDQASEEDAPLPSNESVAKVVAAMRNGTLGPDTLAPRPAPKATNQDLTAAAAAPVQTPEGAIPQAPASVVAAAAGNGNKVTSEQPAEASASVINTETNPS